MDVWLKINLAFSLFGPQANSAYVFTIWHCFATLLATCLMPLTAYMPHVDTYPLFMPMKCMASVQLVSVNYMAIACEVNL